MRIVDTAMVHIEPYMDRINGSNKEFVNFNIVRNVDRANVRDEHELIIVV